MRRSLAAAVVLAMAFVSGALIARGSGELRSPLTLALGTLPDVTLTANFTDWRLVRSAVDATDVSSNDREAIRQLVLDAAYDDDLSAVSGLVGSAPAMADPYGWSVLDLDWEIYGQARQGAVIVAELGENIAPDDVTAGLARLGYAEPDSDADSGGAWRGGPDLVARIDPTLTPLLEHVAVLADPGLIVLSDTPSYVERTVDTITSESGGMGGLADVAATAAPLDGAITAIVHRPPRACAVTSFDTASSSDRALAAARISDVGGLRSHQGLGFAVQPSDRGLELVVAMHFDTAAIAEEQRAVRTGLASGPAIGQGGTYDERFSVVDSEVRNSDLILVLLPVEAHMSLVSDLANSPLLFAGCDG
ncbi:MAG TPA: hypothetical protein VFR22_13825 [Nocardioidaceae bacterium]|nr:hypothetical protein [Nocardioidaceae bacterium]